MADRTIDEMPTNVPEFEGILEAVLLQALDVGREKMESGEELVPFTALAIGDKLVIETHPGDDAEQCFAAAQHTVQNVRGAAAYAFCYDGYVETNTGELDAIIAEGGVPGAMEGHAIGCLYTTEGEGDNFKVKMDERPLYIGTAPNFMEFALYVEGEDEDDVGSESAEEETDDAQADDEVASSQDDEADEPSDEFSD
ncbi:MAG: hypothetical protein IJ131_01830 [Eggerthellaceae bacterium]|nr:hypothetical protein [Eggerthellaceae bacterium]